MSNERGNNRPLWIFAVTGLVLFAIGLTQGLRLQRILTTWPQVSATVTQSRLTKTEANEFNSELTFRYEINGQSHTSTVRPGRPSGIREAVEAKVAAMPPGSQHKVRVDPENPAHILFNAGYNPEFFLMPLVLLMTGLVIAAIGFAPIFLNRPAAPARSAADSVPQMIGAVFAVVGLIVAGLGFWMGTASQSRSTWPQVEAAVTRSRIVSAPRSKGGTHYALALEFRYHVGGRDIAAPATLGDTTDRSRVERALLDFPVGSRHKISYNPNDAQAIQLSNEGLTWPTIIGALGAFFTLLGALCCFVFRTKPALRDATQTG